jgi:hypothetical protein
MTLSSLIVPAVVIELLLSVAWNKLYFSWGLPVYVRRIRVPDNFSWQLPITSMEAGVARRFWPVVAFSGISNERCVSVKASSPGSTFLECLTLPLCAVSSFSMRLDRKSALLVFVTGMSCLLAHSSLARRRFATQSSYRWFSYSWAEAMCCNVYASTMLQKPLQVRSRVANKPMHATCETHARDGRR